MASLPRAGPSKQPPGNRHRLEPPKPKREQISVACEACRQRKAKCSGERPVCKTCRDRDQPCEYAFAAGLTPVAAIKRKYETLQAESADEHNLLGFLRTGSEQDAIKVLAYFRSSDDVQATLQQVRNIPDEASDSTALDVPAHPSACQAANQPCLQATPASMETSSMYPELTDSDWRTPWALPIEPSTTDSNGASTSKRQILRRTPSVPELAQSRKHPMIRPSKQPVARSDSRLDEATTERWGITCVSDNTFRKVLTSYMVWDHPCWEVFDIDEFCKAVSGKFSELSSRLLVMVVFAYGLRLYVHFDRKVAYNYSTAREEAERLWQESADRQDDSIATAAAGSVLFILYGSDGLDKLGSKVLLRSQQILLDKGLFDPSRVEEAYNHGGPANARLRAGIAYGMLHCATMVELYVRPSTLLLTTPPVPLPSLRVSNDDWSPWPMTTLKLPARTDELNMARAGLGLLMREMLELQQKHGNAAMDEQYLNEAQSMHQRYQDWYNSLEYGLQFCEFASQQHILLYAIYHFAVFELFRPIVTSQDATQSNGEEISAPPTHAIAARDASIKALRQLLVRREALYGGLGINTLFSSPALAVVFEALPTASPTNPGYTPSAHMAFITGLRVLMHISRGIYTVYYAVLGVQQAASRLGLDVPMEAKRMFEEAGGALESTPWQRQEGVSSNWFVDFSRPAANDDAARLGNLVKEMEGLGMRDGE